MRRAADIAVVARLLDGLERRAGPPAGQVRLLPWIETAEAIVNCDAICHASERVVAGFFFINA